MTSKEAGGGKRELTEKELEARRRNAKRSTGPRTAAGKARVAENAVRHGCYARTSTAICRGPLEEDPNEVAAFHEAMVSLLDPQTMVEDVLARDIARLAWRQCRLDRYENLALSDDRFGGPDALKLEYAYANALGAQTAAEVLKDLHADWITSRNYDQAAGLLWVYLGDEDLDVPNYPLDGPKPSDPEVWRSVIAWLIERGHGTLEQAAAYAASCAEGTTARYTTVRDDMARAAARSALEDGLLAKSTDIDARIRRELARTLDRYEELHGPVE